MRKLTEKQKKFCHEYIKDYNGTQALIRAGYSEKYKFGKTNSMLKKPLVNEYLESLKSKDTQTSRATIDDIISECKTIAFSTVDGEIIKTADKLKALEMLGKYLGLFSERSREPYPEPIVHVYFEDKTGGK